jgi:biopolymer transport protein ExbB/TolQ
MSTTERTTNQESLDEVIDRLDTLAGKYRVDFPADERAKTDVSMLGVSALATLLTFAILGAIYPFEHTFIRDLIMGREGLDFERLTFQGLTIWMWMLSLANVVLKVIRIKRETKILKMDLIPYGLDMHDFPLLISIYEKIMAHPKLAKSVALMRIAHILGMWINTEDFERTAQAAKESNELDIFVSDSSFRANRLFIWAMPLLGFLGTVYGVSYGIGGFADFLRGQVTAEEIKYQVGLITEGLAVAFYCTLLGLCTAGVAAFPSLFIERKEEEVLGEIDEYVQSRLISRMPSVRKAEFPVDQIVAIRKGIENIKIDVHFPVDDLAKAIQQGFDRFPDATLYEKVFMKSIESATAMVDTHFNRLNSAYQAGLSQVLEGMLASFKQSKQELQGSLQTVAQEFREFQSGLYQSHQKVVAGEINQLQGALENVQAATLRATAQYEQNLQSLNAATKENAEQTRRSSESLAQRLEQVVKMATQIEELLKVEQSVEKGLVGISSTEDFRKTLADLRKHLETSDAFCRKMSQPRVITLREEPVA